MDTMCSVNLKNQNRVVQVHSGATVKEVLASLAIPFPFPCNGNGTCGKCRIKAKGELAPHTADEIRLLNPEEIGNGIRLACQTAIIGPVSLEFESQPAEAVGAILTAGIREQVELEPLWEQRILSAPESWEECLLRINCECQPERETLRAIADAAPGSTLSLEIFDNRIIATSYDQQPIARYGVAVDIGTTTVAAYLVNLVSGEVAADAAQYNPQARYGADVIARIQYAAEPGGLNQLHSAIIGVINDLIGELVVSKRLNYDQIIQVNCVGNSCMLHLLVGVNPTALGRAPFRPVFSGFIALTPDEMAITMNPKGSIFILPGIGGHVGSDISVGVLACHLEPSRKELLIDIGTNGEIVLAGNGNIFACSTAAGPAFEGAQLSCGMLALPGAIVDVVFQEDDLELTTIADRPPLGLCGSGLLRVIAELLKKGVITASGGFAKNSPDPHLDQQTKRYYLLRDTPKPIYLTQEDIRHFQVGKAAIRTGIELMLRKTGISATELETIYLAGAFGSFLNAADAILLGLLPDIPPERLKIVGNSAGTGAIQCLLSKHRLRELLQKTPLIKAINLADEPDFMEIFTEAMLFGVE